MKNIGGSVSTITMFYTLQHSSAWYTYIILWKRFLWTLSVIHNIMFIIEISCSYIYKKHYIRFTSLRTARLTCFCIEPITCTAYEPSYVKIDKWFITLWCRSSSTVAIAAVSFSLLWNYLNTLFINQTGKSFCLWKILFRSCKSQPKI